MVNENEWIRISKNIDEVKHQRVKDWVKEVKTRDGERCVLCGAGQHLEAHHVFSFKNCVSLRFDLDNGITLCRWCHKKYMPL
jgi:replicative DNA helicase Mcm